jgi:hypothetical protein
MWDGKAALYVATKNRGKIDALGGGKAWPMQAGGPFQWVRPLVHLKHTTINLGLAGWGWNRPGDGEVAAFCGVHFLEFWPVGFFYGIIKLRPGGQIRLLHPVASLNNVTINQRAAGCGIRRPREGAAAPFLRW